MKQFEKGFEKARRRKRYLENREHYLAYAKKYRLEHRELRLAYDRKYYRAHKEELSKKRRERRHRRAHA